MPIETDNQPDTDDFSAAFANFTAPGEGGEGPKEPDPATSGDDGDDAGDPPAGEEGEDAPGEGAEEGGEEGGDDGDADGGEEGGEEGDDGASDEGADPPAGDDDLLDRLKNLLKEPAKQPAAADDDDDDAGAQEPPPLPDIYTEDEKAFLADYEKEWPEVARAEQLRRKAEYRDLIGYVFQEMAKFVKPVADTVETLAVRAQYADITERNPDYEDIRDQVFAWVDEQPAYLQAAYKQVMKSGTVEEVNDLFDRFRADKGLSKDKKPAASGKKVAEPSETAKKAAKSMAPVSTKRSAVPQGDDPNDFDGAFAQYAKTWNK